MSSKVLAGQVCIVTGSTRGVGKGIALHLAGKGAKVYITGRTLDPPKDGSVGGSLRDTASEIEARGGVCIPVRCDHSKDDDIVRLFEQVSRENEGQLDLLVNNAFSAGIKMRDQLGQQFYELPLETWDDFNSVGLRNHYQCAVLASRLMVPRKKGLIINISGASGLIYMASPVFGIGKEALDRMAADCAIELKKSNVAFLSLWPGPVGTEHNNDYCSQLSEEISKDPNKAPVDGASDPAQIMKMFQTCETPEFVGKCIASLAADDAIMKKSGKIVTGADLGREYGLTDIEGHTPFNMRQINHLLKQFGFTRLAWCIPDFVRIPKWILAMAGNKFF